MNQIPLNEMAAEFMHMLESKAYLPWALAMLKLQPDLANAQGSNEYACGFNALTWTTANQNHEMAFAILEKNPQAIAHLVNSQTTHNGHNALTLVIEKWDIKLITEIVKNISIETLESTNYQVHNALTFLLSTYNKLYYYDKKLFSELVLTFIKKSPKMLDFNIKSDNIDEKGRTLFTFCLQSYNKELASQLIDQFTELLDYVIKGSAYDDGHSPLTYLMTHGGRSAPIAAVIAADPTTLDFVINDEKNQYYGLSILTFAISLGHLENVKIVIVETSHKLSQSIEQGEYQGHNAISLAVERSRLDGFEILIFLASIEPQLMHTPLKNWPFEGLTPLGYALQKCNLNQLSTFLSTFPQLIKEEMQLLNIQPQLALSVLDRSSPFSALLIDAEPTVQVFAEDQLQHNAANLLIYAVENNKNFLAKKLPNKIRMLSKKSCRQVLMLE